LWKATKEFGTLKAGETGKKGRPERHLQGPEVGIRKLKGFKLGKGKSFKKL